MSAIRTLGMIQEGTCEATVIAVGNDFYLDNSNIMVLEITCEIKTKWLEGGPTLCRVLARISGSSTLIGQSVDIGETTMI
jgi:hypothetical protein